MTSEVEDLERPQDVIYNLIHRRGLFNLKSKEKKQLSQCMYVHER